MLACIASRPIRPRLASIFILCCALAVVLPSHASLADDTITVNLYESYGVYTLDAPPPEMRPIVLAVPTAFLYRPDAKTTRAWGVNLLTYYPTFTSTKDPENAHFGLECIGVCNGRILVSVANRTHSITPSSPNMGNFIAKARLKWWQPPFMPPNAQTRTLRSVEPFDQAFEQALFNPDGTVGEVERIYMHRPKIEGPYDLTATCVVKSTRTTCTLHFSLTCNPTVYLSVNGIDGSYLSRSIDIREKTDRFVSAMIRDSNCKDEN